MVVYNLKRKKEKAYKVHLVIYIYIVGDTWKKKWNISLIFEIWFNFERLQLHLEKEKKKKNQFYFFFIGKIEL